MCNTPNNVMKTLEGKHLNIPNMLRLMLVHYPICHSNFKTGYLLTSFVRSQLLCFGALCLHGYTGFFMQFSTNMVLSHSLLSEQKYITMLTQHARTCMYLTILFGNYACSTLVKKVKVLESYVCYSQVIDRHPIPNRPKLS